MAAANPNTGTSGAMVFRAGQVIYIEEPYAAVLSSDRSLSTCSCCFRTIKAGETLTPCLRCNRLIYCSDQCFAQDGSYHAVECEVLQLVENFPTEQYRLAVRVISRYLIEKAKDEDTAKYFFSHRRTIDCIPSHINEVNEKEIEYMKQKAQTLKHKLDRAYQAEVSVDELMELLFKIRSSYHVILESSSVRHVKIGLGLYLGATKIRNTCEALQNYVRIFNGPNFVLKAVREFTVQDPLDIRINYVSPNHPLRKRRHDINFRFNFLCECPRCVFEENQQEQNLPTNMETFVESPLVDGWERMAKRFFITVRSFPPGNYHIYLLAYKLQLLAHCRKKQTAAVIYGIRALGDCLDFEDRKQILYMLCHDMAGLGLNDPGHRKHQEFETLRRDAIDLFTLVFDRNCCLVRHLTSLAHRAPRREPTIEEEDQCDEEEEGEEEEDDDEEEEDEDEEDEGGD